MLGRIDDMRLHDAITLDEILLTGRLMAAAAESDDRLPLPRIDAVLGVRASTEG
jgi:hypothetical protein